MTREEAIKEIKTWDFLDNDEKEILKTLIPELAESEDEKIRKELIAFLKENHETGRADETWSLSGIERWIAWLEKQGEQKTFDYENATIQQKDFAPKPEPKFKVGDWVVCEVTGSAYQIKNCIENLNNHKYGYDLTNGGYIGSDEVNIYHLWTIQDAKDGDVLFLDLMCGKTFIYNGVNSDMAILYSFIISNDGNDVLPYHIGKPNTGIGTIEDNKNIIHPATKEQRDTLFAAMKAEGYEWNAEKKEVKRRVITENLI